MRADIFDKVGHSESNSSARRDFWKDSVVFISRGAEEGRKEGVVGMVKRRPYLGHSCAVN